MAGGSPQILRTGAVVKVAPAVGGEGVAVRALSYVDLRFADGHVERWLGPGSDGPRVRGVDDPRVLVALGEEVIDEQRDSLLWELNDSFHGIRPADLERAPIEVVIEWNAEIDPIG